MGQQPSSSAGPGATGGPSRDPWAEPGAQGISTRSTLVALAAAFVGLVVLATLFVGAAGLV